MSEIKLDIVTPSKSVFNGEIKSITVPGSKGSFQVLKNHAPLVSTIDIGHLSVETPDNKTIHYATGGGTIEVLDNKILILADSIEQVEDIDLARAKSAKERAEERMAKRNSEEINSIRAEMALERAVNRIKLKEKY